MNKKYLWVFIMVLLLLAFPQKAHCAEDTKNINYRVSYLCYDESHNFWIVRWIQTHAHSAEDIAPLALEALFTGLERENTYRFPDNTAIKSISLDKALLTVDLTKEVTAYGGGSYQEAVLVVQILKTALDIEGVEKVTLLVDGDPYGLPEGTILKEVTTWNDWMDVIGTN